MAKVRLGNLVIVASDRRDDARKSPAGFAFAKAINVAYGNRSLRAGFGIADREAAAREIFHRSRDRSKQERPTLFLNLKINIKSGLIIYLPQDVRLFVQLVNCLRARLNR